jgi:predicted dehydrogenase
VAVTFIQVGCGGWGGRWVAEFLPPHIASGRALPLAVVDIRPEVAAAAAAAFRLPADRAYPDAARAFERHADADFAIVVVPPASHEAIVDLAVAAGMHILSEKPIADTMAGCVRVYKKVRAAGLKMAVTMSHRFDQDKQTLAREVASGRYGRLNYVVGRNTWNCRRRGDWGEFRYDMADPLLVESTVHRFDIIRAVAGANASRVYALTWNPAWSDFQGDCSALITIEMTNGVKVFYEGAKANASALNSWGFDYFRAECERGTLELDNRVLRLLRSSGNDRPSAETLPLAEQPAWMNTWLAGMFIDWLEGGPEPPSSLEDNIQCAALQFAALESARSGRPVDVQEFLERHMREVAV